MDMPQNKTMRVIKFLGFAITLWLLCIAYAIISLGD